MSILFPVPTSHLIRAEQLSFLQVKDPNEWRSNQKQNIFLIKFFYLKYISGLFKIIP